MTNPVEKASQISRRKFGQILLGAAASLLRDWRTIHDELKRHHGSK